MQESGSCLGGGRTEPQHQRDGPHVAPSRALDRGRQPRRVPDSSGVRVEDVGFGFSGGLRRVARRRGCLHCPPAAPSGRLGRSELRARRLETRARAAALRGAREKHVSPAVRRRPLELPRQLSTIFEYRIFIVAFELMYCTRTLQ